MDIQPLSPLTRVVVLKNVPLSEDYEHSINWESASVQASQFLSRKKYDFNNLSPIKTMNTVRVDINAMELYDCNYLMFQNKNFLNKWFYAFIKNVNFINQNMCEIQFEIDVLQTWWYDFEFTYCFIEREHIWNSSLVENFGDNMVDENLETGDYIYQGYSSLGIKDPKQMYVCVWTTEDADGTPTNGRLINRIYQGAAPNFFPTTDVGIRQLNNFLIKMTEENKQEAIVSITMFPYFAESTEEEGVQIVEFNTLPRRTSFGSFVPKNKKTLQYPYKKLMLSNGFDQNIELNYDLLSENVIKCAISLSPNTTVIAYPSAYGGRINDIGNSVSISNFPSCSYAIDSYKAWLAQNQGFNLIKGTAAVVGGAVGAATGNPVLLGGSFMTILNLNQEQKIHEMAPAVQSGSVKSDGVWSANEMDIYCYEVTIRPEYAKIIDDFFNLYGYAVKRVGFPYCVGRKNWNYIKTVGCNISSAYPIIPANDAKKICEIMDKGITFWHNWEVGNYLQDNPMVKRPDMPGPYPPTLRGK